MTSSSSTVTFPAERLRSGGRVGLGVPPEIDLIKRCVRVGSAPTVPDAWAPASLNWSRLVDFARSHGVLALVGRTLKAGDWDGVPLDVVRSLSGYRAALTARNVVLARKLLDVLDLLGRHGITAIPYKGPVLAMAAYGDIGLRPFGDLDLLLPERDVLRARRVLLAAGYESLSPNADAAHGSKLPAGYALPLRCTADGVVVELHWKLSPVSRLPVEWLLAAARPVPLLDSSVPCLAPEHFLLALCVHGAKHAWERLEWVCGVAHLIDGSDNLDWDRVVTDAGAWHARRPVALGLALAARVADAPVPHEILRAIGAHRVRALAADIEARLLRDEPGSAGPITWYSLLFRAATVHDRATYFAYLQRPSEKDRAFVALPSRLSFLYVLARPWRLLSEQTKGRDRPARRALARQRLHQAQKAAALAGREDEVIAVLGLKWDRVQSRLASVNPGLDDPRLLEVGSGAHGIVFGSGRRRAVGVDPLAADYKRLFPAWQGAIPTIAAVGESLPFPDASFDVVLSDNVVDHAESPAAIVAEMARVLRPGGVLYFTVNVHHRLYAVVASAHRAWTAAGVPLEIGPFADHTFHFTPDAARRLFRGLPLDVRLERVHLGEAKVRARRRRFGHPGHLLPLVFFKNAPFEVVAVRR